MLLGIVFPFFSLFFYIFILQIEPILSGNLPPGFDSSTCRSVWVLIDILFCFFLNKFLPLFFVYFSQFSQFSGLKWLVDFIAPKIIFSISSFFFLLLVSIFYSCWIQFLSSVGLLSFSLLCILHFIYLITFEEMQLCRQHSSSGYRFPSSRAFFKCRRPWRMQAYSEREGQLCW